MLLSKRKQHTKNLDLGSLVASIDLKGELHITRLDGTVLNNEEVIAKLKIERKLNRDIAIVWVPTEKVVITDVIVPGKRKALWMAALPFALEEGLSEAVEHYHFVPYQRTEEGMVSVAITRHDDMKNWKRIVESYGLGHVQLVADCFRIDETRSQHNSSDSINNDNVDKELVWNRVLENERCLVRVDKFHGFACNQAWYETLKSKMLNRSHDDINLILSEKDVNSSALLTSHSQVLPKVLKLSLSQFDYKSNASSLSSSWKQFTWVGAVSIAILFVFLATTMLQTQQLKQQTAYTKKKTTELFKTLFPKTKRIVNIKSQTLTYLKQNHLASGDNAKLVSIIKQVEPWFNQVKNVKVEQMLWQRSAKSNLLSFKVSAPSSADLQKVIALSKKEPALANNKPGLVDSELTKVSMRLTLKNVSSNQAQGVIYVDAN
ncbi:type II secretion system protein GspL [Thiomicrorhabdus sp. Milos-T2]|uniref:type II secretion system protein GspL n=1 Tax=Thiomicrorhabdus sp. Milos-T2 TaxID=90814 RepID=UPI0004949683|nr:type II secretion system protein GspL [Thiomicrorhabdus sp. Milos-T2]